MRRATFIVLLAAVALFVVTARGRDEISTPIPDAAAPGPAYAQDRRSLGAAIAVWPLRDDEAYRAAFAEYFDSLTPENVMKWEQIHPSRTRFDFDETDRLVEWAGRHAKRVRGHPLVWDQQLPRWLTSGKRNPVEVRRILIDHVTALVARYKGRVESWDVINEPFEDDGDWSPTLFYKALRERYVEVSLRAARAADPDARLFINELAAERPGHKQDALFELVRDLKVRGVPIDGVGFQNHTSADKAPSRRELERTIRRFAGLGLDVEITEMDVTLATGAPAGRQSGPYADAAAACSAVPRCTGLTVWGVTDRYHWLGREKRALLFDDEGAAKPARDPLLAAFTR